MLRGVKDIKSNGVTASRRPVLNDISSNLQINLNGNHKGNITISKPAIATKPTTRFTAKYVY